MRAHLWLVPAPEDDVPLVEPVTFTLKFSPEEYERVSRWAAAYGMTIGNAMFHAVMGSVSVHEASINGGPGQRSPVRQAVGEIVYEQVELPD